MTTAGAACRTGSDIRILLVGRTGHGKSSTANSIIGFSKFKTSWRALSETSTTHWSGNCERFGRTIEVVDTPGFFDTHQSEMEVHKQLVRSLLFTMPGFHAIAFVFEIGRFTKELVETKNLFFNWFGKGVEKYACIILTRTENEEDVDDYVNPKNTTKDLDDLVQKCGGRKRIAAIENKPSNEEKREAQVKLIIEMVERIKLQNNKSHFTNTTFMLATAYVNNYHSEDINDETIPILRTAYERTSIEERKMLRKVFKSSDGMGKKDTTRAWSNAGYSEETPKKKSQAPERGQEYRASESERLNEYKRALESGQVDESGFFNFMINAWSYFTQKVRGCVTM